MSALISVAQLTQLRDAQIIEVGEKTADPLNTAQVFALYENQHIRNARYVDLTKHFSKQTGDLQYQCPSVDEFEQSFKALGLDWNRPIVIYDRANHIWAARLWWVLTAYGHSATYVLEGGWHSWLNAMHTNTDQIAFDQTVQNSDSSDANLAESLTFNQTAFADLEEVLAVAQGSVNAQLINVLRKPVFDGTELRYHRAGHIPQSRNIPFAHFLDEHGQFKRIDSNFLLQHMLELSKDIIVYCGSGVTASGAALALLEAGAHSVKIYDGSMDEWSANPSLPLILSAE